MIEVEDLTVRFGGVMSIDQMSDHLLRGNVRSHRAERCRQDDVLQRAVRIRAPSAGVVRAFGDDLLVMADYERARWGVRRTFQTEQAIENLTVYDNVLARARAHGGERATPSVVGGD